MTDDIDITDKVSIQNIVGSGKLTVEIKTELLADDLENHVDDESYTWMDDGPQPGLYYELDGDEGPQVTFHESGSYIVRADSRVELDEANDRVIRELKELGVLNEDSEPQDMNFEVQNVVALAQLDQDISLRALSIGLGTDAQYEPEVFPALEYSRPRYPCSFLVYGNGKIILAGASSADEIDGAMEEFYEEMKEWI